MWQLNLTGLDWAGIGSLLSSILGIIYLLRSVEVYEVNRRIKKARHIFSAIKKTQGSSHFASTKDTKKAGMHPSGGIFLGSLDGKEIYHHGEGSVFVFAPPGSGKGTCSVVPQLLQIHTDPKGRPVSLFCLDVKGENYAVCSKRLRQLGYDVICIAPWAQKMSRELGITINDAGFNPLMDLLTAGEDTKDLADLISSLLLPGSAKDNSSSEYFLDFGRSINAWGLLVLAERGDPLQINLSHLRKLLMSPPEELDELLTQASQSNAFNGALSQYAHKLINTKCDAPEEWSGAINTATKALGIYDDYGPMGKHVSVINGFDFSTIKSKPTCVMLMIPSERTKTHASWLNLVMSYAIERMGQDRTNKRVICLFDEFFSIGIYMPNILRALGLYRGVGLIFLFYAQTASQASRIYSETGFRDFLGMCDVIQAFGVRDPQVLKMLSELAGNDTVREYSSNMQPDVMGSGQHIGFSANASSQGRAIIRPEDIRTLPDDKQLVFYKNLPPILMDKVSYLNHPKWRKYASPNPYYRP